MDYSLRGRCKELSENFVLENPDYKVVKGWYYEYMWTGKEMQEHWWCKHKETGEIHDPTSEQFPSGGIKQFYKEFNGFFICEQCGKEKPEMEMKHEGRFHFCSSECYGKCIGVITNE